MDDLISRQAAIDAIKALWDGAPTAQHVSAMFDCEDAIQALPSAQPKHGRWIPCEERMPEEPFGCLVTVMDTEPMTGEEFENILPYFVGWDGEQWNDYDGYQCPFEVLAWMPLPEPYKTDDGSGIDED